MLFLPTSRWLPVFASVERARRRAHSELDVWAGSTRSLACRIVGFRASFLSLRPVSGDGVYIRAEPESLPSQASDMLVARTGQLTTGDLHPIRLAALSAAPASLLETVLDAPDQNTRIKEIEIKVIARLRKHGRARPCPSAWGSSRERH